MTMDFEGSDSQPRRRGNYSNAQINISHVLSYRFKCILGYQEARRQDRDRREKRQQRTVNPSYKDDQVVEPLLPELQKKKPPQLEEASSKRHDVTHERQRPERGLASRKAPAADRDAYHPPQHRRNDDTREQADTKPTRKSHDKPRGFWNKQYQQQHHVSQEKRNVSSSSSDHPKSRPQQPKKVELMSCIKGGGDPPTEGKKGQEALGEEKCKGAVSAAELEAQWQKEENERKEKEEAERKQREEEEEQVRAS